MLSIKKFTLKELRIKNKKTQENLAKVIDKSISAYNMIENGKRNPSLEDALKIAKFYKLKVEQINFFAT